MLMQEDIVQAVALRQDLVSRLWQGSVQKEEGLLVKKLLALMQCDVSQISVEVQTCAALHLFWDLIP